MAAKPTITKRATNVLPDSRDLRALRTAQAFPPQYGFNSRPARACPQSGPLSENYAQVTKNGIDHSGEYGKPTVRKALKVTKSFLYQGIENA
ncbi:hypothetical protein [Amycolatopsis tolypomycina]|uniref:hypothetical protein n=1 Tax=Amycolatopsis tolypomycina TaxID=208445 RepID=UPI00115F7816|nr:hypothetical protein [Amycolatopsis tolypomycina]